MDKHETEVVNAGHTYAKSKSHSFQSHVRLRGGMTHSHNREVSCFFLPAPPSSAEGLHVRFRKLLVVRCVYEMVSTQVYVKCVECVRETCACVGYMCGEDLNFCYEGLLLDLQV